MGPGLLKLICAPHRPPDMSGREIPWEVAAAVLGKSEATARVAVGHMEAMGVFAWTQVVRTSTIFNTPSGATLHTCMTKQSHSC